MEGSLAAGGGLSGGRPAVGCARLAARLLLSQVAGDHAGGGPGRFRVPRGLQHRGHEWERGLPEKKASPPVSRVSFGETRGVGDGFSGALGTAAGAVTGSGAQAAAVVVVGGHERAARGDGCHALAWGLLGTSAATPRGPRRTITDGGDGDARPRNPSARETADGRSMGLHKDIY